MNTDLHERVADLRKQIDGLTSRLARPRKRRMVDFAISEISAVDSPAQRPALAAITKAGRRKLSPAEQAAERRLLASLESDDVPPATLEEAARRFEQRDKKLSRTAAMSKARRRYPALFTRFQREGEVAVAKAAVASAPKPTPVAVSRFTARVDSIAKHDGCGRLEAMIRARREHPAEFAAYQATV